MTQDKTPQDKPNIAEAVARVLNPDLFSDNLEIAHTAASPYKLDLCKLKALQRARAVLEVALPLLEREIINELYLIANAYSSHDYPEAESIITAAKAIAAGKHRSQP